MRCGTIDLMSEAQRSNFHRAARVNQNYSLGSTGWNYGLLLAASALTTRRHQPRAFQQRTVKFDFNHTQLFKLK